MPMLIRPFSKRYSTSAKTSAGMKIGALPDSAEANADFAAVPSLRPSIRSTKAMVSETNSLPRVELVIVLEFALQVSFFVSAELPQFCLEQQVVPFFFNGLRL